MGAAPVVETTALTKVYRSRGVRTEALSGLDLAVPQSSVFGLIGANGSGKSTTIKLLLALIRPTSGTVRIFGQSPRKSAVRARVGFLPEESNLYPFLSGRETLELFGRLLALPRPERRRKADELLERVDMAAHADRRVGTYSKGMARRIGLAQALLGDPELLLLDEPTSGLDPLGIRWFQELLLELKGAGRTVLICSHILGQVEELCDRLALLHQGRLVLSGPLAELLDGEGRTLQELFLQTVDGLDGADR